MLKRIGDLLAEYLRQRGWQADDPCAKIFLDWNATVGEPFCEHTKPVELTDGVLSIEADHPGWLQMVSLKKASLLGAIRKAAPRANITEIKARLGIKKN
jgi:predicted nucleic acid-binding Zn ribbon protein